MHWGVLALLTAFFESAKDVLGKRSLKQGDPIVVAWAWRFLALPFLIPVAAIAGVPDLGPDFGWALFLGGSLNVMTSILYMRAIQLSDLSLTVPMVAFTPLFLLITSPVLLGEIPESRGMVGVILIVAGTYLMKVKERSAGFLAPFRALWREPGPRWMLLVALIWSLTANIDKVGLQNSSPIFWSLSINLFIACALLPTVVWRTRRTTPTVGAMARMLPLGAAGALTTLCQMAAISLTLVPYVIAVKRTSTIMTVLWGIFLFGEKGMKERLGGATLMVVGVILILL
jgi:uncharacterized membrane protein